MLREQLAGAQLLRLGSHALACFVGRAAAQRLDPLLDLLRERIGLAGNGHEGRTIGGKVLVFGQGENDGLAAVLVCGERRR